jgi:hypothetical protein
VSFRKLGAILSSTAFKTLSFYAALIGFSFGAIYVIRLLIFLVLMAQLLHTRDFMDALARNARGDVARAETDFFGAPEHRSTTIVWLKRTDHWFSTTLIQSHSWDVLVGLRWRDDDTLVLQLDFGCDAKTTPPVTQVGPIHILYRFGDPGHVPKTGYETFRRRDLPPEPCQ